MNLKNHSNESFFKFSDSEQYFKGFEKWLTNTFLQVNR